MAFKTVLLLSLITLNDSQTSLRSKRSIVIHMGFASSILASAVKFYSGREKGLI